MWIYKETERGCWTVGYVVSDDELDFQPESDHESREAAAARINYLNGGDGLPQGPLTRVAIAIPEVNNL
jgi:hypothetical protein